MVTGGDFALVAGREQQMLAAFACVGAGKPHIHDPTLVMIVGQRDKRSRRQLDDQRPILQVKYSRAIRRVGVGREDDVPRPGREDHHVLIDVHPQFAAAVEDAFAGDGRIPKAIRRDGPLEILRVPRLL